MEVTHSLSTSRWRERSVYRRPDWKLIPAKYASLEANHSNVGCSKILSLAQHRVQSRKNLFYGPIMDKREALRREHGLHPRTFGSSRYAYPVLSRRSGGVSFGLNLNLDKKCNFDCPYCQVDRKGQAPPQELHLGEMRRELESLLASVNVNGTVELEKFADLLDSEKKLRDIALSGDGESTMVPEFERVCSMLYDLQTAHSHLDFRLVLITNATLLDRPAIQRGIASLLARNGQVWAKLDAGTESWFQRINVSRVPLDRIEANLIALGKLHSLTIQSFFCKLDGAPPDDAELDAYIGRLRRVRDGVLGIDEVQLYSLARAPADSACTPVSSDFLTGLRSRVSGELSLTAKVYGALD